MTKKILLTLTTLGLLVALTACKPGVYFSPPGGQNPNTTVIGTSEEK